MELTWLSSPVLFSILTTFSFEPDYFRISAIPRLSKMLNDNRESTFVSKTGSYMAYFTTKNRCNKSTKFLRQRHSLWICLTPDTIALSFKKSG